MLQKHINLAENILNAKKDKMDHYYLNGHCTQWHDRFLYLERGNQIVQPGRYYQIPKRNIKVEVVYNRPYKGEGTGGSCSYGEVWRTGANEATTF